MYLSDHMMQTVILALLFIVYPNNVLVTEHLSFCEYHYRELSCKWKLCCFNCESFNMKYQKVTLIEWILGRGKLWRISYQKLLAGKTLANSCLFAFFIYVTRCKSWMVRFGEPPVICQIRQFFLCQRLSNSLCGAWYCKQRIAAWTRGPWSWKKL